MGLVRAWARQLCGASAAVLLVEGPVLAALAVLALAGGFGGLGAIGQAYSGPVLSGASRSLSGSAAARASASLAGALNAARATSSTTAPAVLRRAPLPPGGAGGRTAPVAPQASGPGLSIQGHGGFGNTGAGSPSGPSAPVPVAQRPPAPSVVGNVLSAASSSAKQLPGPAGHVATQALQSVSSTAHKLLPGAQ